MADFDALPIDLRKGSIARAYRLAKQSTPSGNYEDGTQRNFTCQTCHMSPVEGYGCSMFSTPLRSDIPKHDLTGGNYWAPDAILYLESQGRLYGGNGLTVEPQELGRDVGQRQHAARHEPHGTQADLGLCRGSAHVAQREVVRRRGQRGARGR
jgi:hypothetical protein